MAKSLSEISKSLSDVIDNWDGSPGAKEVIRDALANLNLRLSDETKSQNSVDLDSDLIDLGEASPPLTEVTLESLGGKTLQHSISPRPKGPSPLSNGDLGALIATLPPVDDDRYEVREHLGGGGQGSVQGVYDRYLHRLVALKAMHGDLIDETVPVKSFLKEIFLTAQLSHPGIVSIHDVSRLPNGAPAYTMKRVQGRSLRQIINALRNQNESAVRHWGRRRLLEALVQVCYTVGYAHAQGVIHRDLKPPNIMLGGYGEVQILDWGVARLIQSSEEGAPAAAVTLPGEMFEETLQGVIKGTLTYMAPEQATGKPELLGPWSDVYALGLILHEILTLRPARPSLPGDEMLALVRSGVLVSPEVRRREDKLPVSAIPEELENIIGLCCAVSPDERYRNGESVAKAIQSYLDGEARRALSRQRTKQGDDSAREAREAEEEILRLKREVIQAQNTTPPWAPIAERRRVWELEDEVQSARTRHDSAFSNAIALYTQALGDDPENRDARRSMARLYMERLREAEEMGRVRDSRLYEAQIRRLDDGSNREALKGEGTLELITNPPGADVWLYQLSMVDRINKPTEGRRLGRSPMKVTDLPMGRYLAVVGPGSGQEVRCPVLIRRQGHWISRINLAYNIPEEFIYVPGGSTIFGGDRAATGSGPRQVRDVEDFAISRLPVTCEDYRRFLNAIAKRDGQKAAERHAPRPTSETGTSGRPLWHIRRGGGFRIPSKDRTEGIWGPLLPVRHVSREDAEAFCAWKSETEGRPYRLPTEEEWEKSARGVDGRWYPWGDLFDPSLCKMRDTRPGPPEPEPVGSVPLDESPYGVRDMAGNIMEWCATPFDRHDVMGVVKGGFWLSSAESCRAARRFGFKPMEPSPFAGFRLVLDILAEL